MMLESLLYASYHGYVVMIAQSDSAETFGTTLATFGLVSAGYNIYRDQKYSQISPEAGTGMLNSLGVKLTDICMTNFSCPL